MFLIIGGSLGTVSRYFVSGVIYQVMGSRFPYGTLVVNLLGCFLIGFCAVIFEEKFLFSANIRLFLMIGFLGAFTTFSTFILESANLIRDGQALTAFWNILASIVIGFLVFRLGILVGEII